jgi:DHA1 family multidrug resistance protein-like MFS transporter
VWGQVADRHGRKLMLLRSSFAIALFTALMGASGNVWQFFACRALMGVFAGFSSAAIALVASQVPEDRLGYSLGWLSTGQLVGSLVGPIIGGILADLTASYRIPFYVTAATIFLSIGLVWFGVREEFTRHHGEGRRGTFSSLFALVTTPALLALFFVLLMAQFGVRTVQPIVTLYVKEMVGDLPNLATLAGIAFSITGLANVISAPFLGNRSDRIGYRRVLLICLAGGTLTTLPQAFTDNYWLFTAERFAVGLFIGGLLPAANALVGRLVSRAERGLRHDLLGDVSRQLGRALIGRRDRRLARSSLGVPDDRHRHGGQPPLGLLPRPGIPAAGKGKRRVKQKRGAAFTEGIQYSN